MKVDVGGKTLRTAETADGAIRKVEAFPFYGSGSGKLDGILGGGYRAGTLTEIFGRSNSGKSQLAMQATVEAASLGHRVLYIDTEGSFRPERLEQMSLARGRDASGILERVVCVRSDSAAEQMEAVRRMQSRATTASCRMVVVDTLTRNFSVDLPGASNIASRQEAIDVHLSEMSRDAYLNSRAYILTNRVTFGPVHDVPIGGKTVEQLVSASVRLERNGSGVTATREDSGRSVVLEMSGGGVL
ncbi:MAG: AAA family ATPase [Nitrososphaerota archaeon]|nr:AAA family ATPase [Nitrososphaerota archaeon]